MYQFSKISILILYPLSLVAVPLSLFGVAFEPKALSMIIMSNSLIFIFLVVVSLYYLYKVYRMKVFKKGVDGNMQAKVSDYFSYIFSWLIIVSLVSNLFKLI